LWLFFSSSSDRPGYSQGLYSGFTIRLFPIMPAGHFHFSSYFVDGPCLNLLTSFQTLAPLFLAPVCTQTIPASRPINHVGSPPVCLCPPSVWIILTDHPSANPLFLAAQTFSVCAVLPDPVFLNRIALCRSQLSTCAERSDQ